MKTAPITPARIEFRDGEPPRSEDYGDIYHPRIGAREQARQVFLAGNDLPGRWSGRERFVILETGFGLGNNFLATWQAWREDPARCRQLFFVSVEAHPPSRDDLRRAHGGDAGASQLIAAWPPATPGLHLLEFEDGRLRLLLALGDATRLLPRLRLRWDAAFLDGFAPDRNPAMWQPRVIKAIARLAAADATLATWCVARSLRDGLRTAGFDAHRVPGIGGKREVLRARFAPHVAAPPSPAPARDAVIVGAGLAGAWAAWSLARQGCTVTVLERHADAAAETSGNPAGLFHGTVHADDGLHARLHRAATLLVAARLGTWFDSGAVRGALSGVLRIESRLSLDDMRATVGAQGLPLDWAEALDASAASERAGVALAHPAWWYPRGGWVDPRSLVRHLLGAPGIRFVPSTQIRSLRREGGRWLVETAGDPCEADALVLAAGAANADLARGLGDADWPITTVRGQISHWPQTAGHLPRLPLAGDGYVLRDGPSLLCGAASQPGDAWPHPRDEDHALNIQRLTRLIGRPPDAALPWTARVGWRQQVPDRLPIAGAVAAAGAASARPEQVGFQPRVPGLFVIGALGGRGITLAAIAAELVAARIGGTPWPLEVDLAEAMDPARWLVRAARRQRGAEGSGLAGSD